MAKRTEIPNMSSANLHAIADLKEISADRRKGRFDTDDKQARKEAKALRDAAKARETRGD